MQVGSELLANFTNQANLPYRGRAYDKVLMNTYKALNYLQLGDVEAARVEINRSLNRQRDAVADNAKQIEVAEAAARKTERGRVSDGGQTVRYDVSRAEQDPRLQSSLSGMQSQLDRKIIQSYGDYVNPFAVYLDGLFHLYQGVDGSDLERARKSLARVAAMVPANPYLDADITAAETGRIPDGLTYVIYETGLAPWREQLRIDVPTFIVSQTLSYVGASVPKLAFSSSYLGALRASDGSGLLYQSAEVADMDSVVAQDFSNEWPAILTRTLISAGTKIALDATLQKQARDNFGEQGQLLVGILSALTQYAVNVADTRSWRSLPKEFQLIRLATPENRQIILETDLSQKTITVEPGRINVVYVKSVTQIAPLQIAQFKLK